MVPEMRPFFATGRTQKNHRGHQKCAIPKVETISPKGRQSAAHLYRKQTNKSKVWVKLARLCILNASSRGVLQVSISMSSARRLCPPNKISTEATVVLSCDYRLAVLSTNSAVTEASSQKMEPYSGPVFGTDFRYLVNIFAIVFSKNIVAWPTYCKHLRVTKEHSYTRSDMVSHEARQSLR